MGTGGVDAFGSSDPWGIVHCVIAIYHTGIR